MFYTYNSILNFELIPDTMVKLSVVLYPLIFLVLFLHVFGKPGEPSITEALVGSSAKLTCDLSPNQGDQPVTVNWFRLGGADSDTPIYTFDTRQQQGNRWSDVNLGERIYMMVASSEAQLVINPLDASDEAQYKCKVDFRRVQSRSQIVNLTVVGKYNFF